MDDKHIEDMLRDSWSPEPPEGMRERVLGRARQELPARRAGWGLLGMSGWKLAFASLCLLTILVSNLADSARQVRLAALMDGFSQPAVSVAADDRGWMRLPALRGDLDDVVASSPTRDRLLNLLERGG